MIVSPPRTSSLKALVPLGAALMAAPLCLSAQTTPDTTMRIAVGGFVDTYYSYDFGRPPSFDRSFAGGALFTTQPARHNEFNVNLAYVEAVLSGPRVRGRVALQVGTSVQSNYSAEPERGIISGGSLGRHIQEAYAGYQLASTLWVDAGVFYSYMGLESWVSRDNPAYTRSLTADYSPYYSSGVRAIWQATPRLAAHLHVVNGWQNMSETNTDKGVGLRLDYTLASSATLSYYNFFNNEVGGRLRVFNGVGARYARGGTTVLGQLDHGTLGTPSAGGASSHWWGFTAIVRQHVTSRVAVVGRFEGFDDEDQVNIATGLTEPFRGKGASVGLDVSLTPRLSWRTEARGFFADAPIFPNAAAAPRKNDGFLVTSMSVTL